MSGAMDIGGNFHLRSVALMVVLDAICGAIPPIALPIYGIAEYRNVATRFLHQDGGNSTKALMEAVCARNKNMTVSPKMLIGPTVQSSIHWTS